MRAAVAVVVMAAAGGAWAALGMPGTGGDGADAEAAGEELPPESAEVTRQTLVDVESADGRLGHGPSAAVGTRLGGTLTRVPAVGEEVARGEALFSVDNLPVVLMYGATPAYRPLEPGAEGPDVEQFEENLAALGYTGFTPDDAYTAATAAAVERWQEDAGLPETGTVELGRVVFAEGPLRVDGAGAAAGDAVAPDGPVLTVTGRERVVTVELAPADRRLAEEGAGVTVRLPDDSELAGVVGNITTLLRPAEGGGEGGSGGGQMETVIQVVVGLPGEDAQEAAGLWDQAGAHVEFTAGERPDVLTVPVAALLALAEGGFGVEVIEGGTSRYVPVTTGLFADGRVEVSGDGLAEGDRVGMPS
ncbi:peptidoglycan-binding protein [Streptomyces sp. DSM 44917]|uniref:Peptidoglycan-binding protein n=1 Tax=Streptomyces boetiae TaxID=3075541 RepID=A0ABU2LBS1_9ACTN|nr:peptidoglycan-binding protein [Streptomyces sp. DSM 44917]MDT0309036.1 peptidoglycan-binding protein [Streptomyces sp. DSM 44917]